ncbi:MAG: GYD domain-containing protein [Dehalococcoidia bacterium]
MLYILLARLTGEGQKRLVDNPDLIRDVSGEVKVAGTQLLARYAVLGRYDFVLIVEADDSECAARLSLEFGAKAGVHIETLQAISAGLLSGTSIDDLLATLTSIDEPREG